MSTTERIDLDDDEAFVAFHAVYSRALVRDVRQTGWVGEYVKVL